MLHDHNRDAVLDGGIHGPADVSQGIINLWVFDGQIAAYIVVLSINYDQGSFSYFCHGFLLLLLWLRHQFFE